VSRLALLALTLAACNQWVRPTPGVPAARTSKQQWESAVAIETSCDPFEDGVLSKTRVGTGVMVSPWQVITALHVTDCQSTIPLIKVTTVQGGTWKMVPEKEWGISVIKGERDGVSRIQLATADDLSPSFGPPRVNEDRPVLWEPLYIETAMPERQEVIGEETGWQYGGDSYGGRFFTYKAETQPGNSGSPIYDINGDLVGVHLGTSEKLSGEKVRYGAIVTPEMVPHR
jgi:hypothetical protein